MPTYDYQCRKCGHRFELFHSISDETPKKCPKCKGRARRVPSAGAGLLFKGSGFYITDYRSKSYKERAQQEKSGGAPGGTSGGAAGGSAGGTAGGSGGSGAAGESGGPGGSSASGESGASRRSSAAGGAGASGRAGASRRPRPPRSRDT